MLNIDELKFDEKGLIPAIVVDADTKKVLTLAYMSRESLKISMERERLSQRKTPMKVLSFQGTTALLKIELEFFCSSR